MKLLFTSLLCFVFFYSKSQIITTIAGKGTAAYSGDSGFATNAELNQPISVDADSSENIYISDEYNNVVRKVNSKSGIITTIAGDGTQGFAGDSGLAIKAQLSNPLNAILDKENNIYINDNGNLRIRKIDTKTNVITTVAGGGSSQQDSGLALNASISPEGIALNKAGTALYFVETVGGGRIRKVDLSTGILTTIINPKYAYYGNELILDSANNIYFSCSDGRIRRIDAPTNTVTVVAGNGISGYSGDGDSAIKAEFALPQGIALDFNNNLYIADFGNARLRKINQADGIINTIAGNGDTLYNGDNIPAITAQLSLWGIKIDGNGNIYVADIDNNRVRKISNSILPVRLRNFIAQKQNNTTLLHWQTANEVNNNYFSVERSPDSKLFTLIGNKPATNNALKSNYSFVDNAPLSGLNYYRLKQVDKDEKFAYSNVVSIDFSSNANTFTVYPNPANNTINVTLPFITKTSAIVLYDATGKEVMHEQVASNIISKQINIRKLLAGVYNVVLVQDGKQQQTTKIVKK